MRHTTIGFVAESGVVGGARSVHPDADGAADRDPDGLDRKPHSQATHRQQKARIGPSRVYDLCQRWDGHAPPELLAELRALECTAPELTRRCCGSRA
jgi:hypothetical protein